MDIIGEALQGEINRRRNQISNSITKSVMDDEIAGERDGKEDEEVEKSEKNKEGKKIIKKATKKDIEKSFKATYYDKLEKGDISDKLTYGYGSGNEPLKFTKTGAEIKAVLPTAIAKLEATKIEIGIKMKALVELIGEEPSEPWACITPCTEQVMRYPYTLIQTEYDDISRKWSDPTDIQKAASSYNDLCYSLKSILEDLAACNIIMNNIEDKKKYDLSVSQLLALNFGNDNLSKGEKDELDKEDEEETENFKKGKKKEKKEKKIEKAIASESAQDVLLADKNMRSAKIGNCIISDSQFDDNVAKSINTEIYSKNYEDNFDEIIKSIQTRNVVSIKEVEMMAKNKIAIFTSDKVNQFCDDIAKAVESKQMTAEEGRAERVKIANLDQKKVQLEKGFATIYVSKTDLQKAIK